MITTNKAVTHLKEPEGAFVLNLSQFPGGVPDSLNRIPRETSGIYAWFRSFNYPSDPTSIFNDLMEDIEKEKFSDRSGSIKPYYEISIRSKSWISQGKRKRINRALFDKQFRDTLLQTLNQSLIFQTPLYISKSTDLRKRIGNHLAEDSILRLRLNEVKIDIHKTLILVIPNEFELNRAPEIDELNSKPDIEPGETNRDLIDDSHEDLYEEIYSRLFSPLFTIRLG